jgi:hypothetical protein
MVVGMGVERRAEAVDEGDRTHPGTGRGRLTGLRNHNPRNPCRGEVLEKPPRCLSQIYVPMVVKPRMQPSAKNDFGRSRDQRYSLA